MAEARIDLSGNITDEKIRKAYETDERFKTYVDAFAESTRKSIDFALGCNIIREVYKHYFNGRR